MNTKIVMFVVLVLMIVLICRSLWHRNQDQASKIDLDDLLLGDDGRLSKSACILFGAFALTSWMMVQLTLTGKMSEGYMTIYAGAWITPTVAVIITKTVVTIKNGDTTRTST